MPAQDVKAYVKRNKNDAADAEAIREAVRRPTMRFIQVKSAEPGPFDAASDARSFDAAADPTDPEPLARLVRAMFDQKLGPISKRGDRYVRRINLSQSQEATPFVALLNYALAT